VAITSCYGKVLKKKGRKRLPIIAFYSKIKDMTNSIWDYNIEELKKTKQGRLLILERMINYGPGGKKISLKEVKKNWSKLNLHPLARRLFELLIWGKYQSSQKNKKKSWI